jgi:hypothetical protein
MGSSERARSEFIGHFSVITASGEPRESARRRIKVHAITKGSGGGGYRTGLSQRPPRPCDQGAALVLRGWRLLSTWTGLVRCN